MPVLTFDVGGPDEMDVECERGGHAAPRSVGGRGYSASGSEWPQIRGELMVVPFVLAPLPWSQIATIRSLFALAKRVNCAGDLFNKPGTIVCSGTITDELHTTADRGTLSGTLFEVGGLTTFAPTTTDFLLTGVPWGDGTWVSTPDVSYPGDTDVSFAVLQGVSLPTCASTFPAPPVVCTIVDSLAPERTWVSVPLAAGRMSGTPRISMLSAGPTNDNYPVMHTQARIYLVRGGVDVAGPFFTDYRTGPFFGAFLTMTCTVSLNLPVEDLDTLRVEFWSQGALGSGWTDGGDSQRQGFTHGSPFDARLVMGGNIQPY